MIPTASPRPVSGSATEVVPQIRERVQAAVSSTPTQILASAAPVVALVSAAATGTSAAAATGSAAGGIGSLLQGFLLFVGVRRRRRLLGRVVENRTGLPVPGAVITVLDTAGKPRERLRSRSNGTFGLLLPKGSYQLSVTRTGYAVATRPTGIDILTEEKLFTGGTLTVEEEETSIPLVVALQPLEEGHRVTAGDRLRSLTNRLQILQARIALPLLLTGATINTVALVVSPTVLLVVYEALYAVLLLMEIVMSRVSQRVVGRVRDAVTDKPVGLALLRLTDEATARLVTTKVTSPQGQFLLLPPPGREYTLEITHAQYKPYVRNRIRVKNRLGLALPVRVELQPRAGAPAETPAPLPPPPNDTEYTVA